MATKQIRINAPTHEKLAALAKAVDCNQGKILDDAVNCLDDLTGMMKKGYVLYYENPNAPGSKVEIHILGYSGKDK